MHNGRALTPAQRFRGQRQIWLTTSAAVRKHRNRARKPVCTFVEQELSREILAPHHHFASDWIDSQHGTGRRFVGSARVSSQSSPGPTGTDRCGATLRRVHRAHPKRGSESSHGSAKRNQGGHPTGSAKPRATAINTAPINAARASVIGTDQRCGLAQRHRQRFTHAPRDSSHQEQSHTTGNTEDSIARVFSSNDASKKGVSPNSG